jgi:PAS domain S-box-containing protein
MSKKDPHSEHAPSDRLRDQLAELTHHNIELEKFNHALTRERESYQKKLADCSRLMKASTTGLISLDKSGLIDSLNTRAIEMLGADKAYVLKKPISLFIAPEDQAVFYLHRSRIFSGAENQPFDINFKTKGGGIWSARITAQPVETPAQQLPGMLLAVEDISAHRQALEALQLKEYFIDLLFSIIDDLTIWSTADIDEIIIYSLEKVGLVSGADRVYVCLFHDGKTRLSITHEWLSEETESPAPALTGAAVKPFSKILSQVKKRKTVAISNIGTLTPADRAAHQGFHAPGAQSFLFTPLFFGRYLLGVIGCDAVKQPAVWSREIQNLVKCVGSIIVNALLRQQAETSPAEIRETLLQFVKPAPPAEGDILLEYEGPIEILDNEAGTAAAGEPQWHFEAGEPEDLSLQGTALLKDGKTANIACKHCNHQKLLDISEIRSIGTRLKVTCACGNEMFIKVELRREHRKAVNFDGVYIRGRGDRIAMKSGDWGRIQITNLSRRGIGFKLLDQSDVRVNDRFRVKFTLDNTASSVVQKEVVVRAVAAEAIGCQFVGKDPCDVTIGFYMMT